VLRVVSSETLVPSRHGPRARRARPTASPRRKHHGSSVMRLVFSHLKSPSPSDFFNLNLAIRSCAPRCYCSSYHSHFLQDLQEHAALSHKHFGQSGRIPVTRCCLSSAARRLCPSLPPSPAQRERVAVAHAAADGDGGDDTARLTRPPQQRISKRPCRRSAPLAAYPPPWACRRAG
jgi:hypothetical protein